MNTTRKRDLPAGAMTQHTAVARDALIALLSRSGETIPHFRDASTYAIAYADALFDALETPVELRDDFDHEGTP